MLPVLERGKLRIHAETLEASGHPARTPAASRVLPTSERKGAEGTPEIVLRRHNAGMADSSEARVARIRGGTPGRNALLGWLRSWVVQRPPPSPLWHFTGTGLEGILRGETLWATNTKSLADESELHYGRQVFREVLGSSDWHCRPETAEVLRSIATDAVLARYLDQLDLDLFVVSLCETGDDWGMWRAYTHWSEGGDAFALGFAPSNAHGWAQSNAPEPNSLFLRSVIYDRVEQVRACRELIECLIPILEDANTKEGLAGPKAADFGRSLTEGLLEFSAWCKAPEFAGEREWRLVYQRWGDEDRPPVRTRSGWDRPIEYVELNLPNRVGSRPDRLPVSTIRCGPGCDRRDAEALLSRSGDWSHVAVIDSELR